MKLVGIYVVFGFFLIGILSILRLCFYHHFCSLRKQRKSKDSECYNADCLIATDCKHSILFNEE